MRRLCLTLEQEGRKIISIDSFNEYSLNIYEVRGIQQELNKTIKSVSSQLTFHWGK